MENSKSMCRRGAPKGGVHMGNEACRSEFYDLLDARGVSRRDFMKLCGAIAVAAGLSEVAVPKVAHALEQSVIGATKGNLYPVIWI